MLKENFIQFENTTYSYPVLTNEINEDGQPVLPKPVYQNFCANLEGGFVSLVGPNASGKSTFMLLASGRLCPQSGTVKILGVDTKKFFITQNFDTGTGTTIPLDIANPATEEEKNLLSSFVYQNMEFENEEKVGELLEMVFQNGGHNKNSSNNKINISGNFFDDVIKIAELEQLTSRKLNALSKGETQRVLFAFSLLYGSKSIFMDEPFFAMEQKQKENALSFLRTYSSENNIPVYISMHELELSQKYAEKILLFYPNRDLDFGTPEEVLTTEALEKAYGVPVAMLKDAEKLTRKQIQEDIQHLKD